MKVSDVRIGDYVVGFGVVDNMMIFYKEIAHEFPSYPKMKYNNIVMVRINGKNEERNYTI